MTNITKADFINAINTLEKGEGEGVVYQKITTLNDGRDLCIVFGYQEGYGEGEKYQKRIGETLYTLCAKLAINIDDLQCDYDYDWYMPYTKEGDVYDTDQAIVSPDDCDYYNREAEIIAEMLNKGDLVLA